MRRVQREDENVPDDAAGVNADTETNAREEIAVFSRVSFALLEIVVRETTGVSNVSRVGVAGGRERVGEKTEREGGRVWQRLPPELQPGYIAPEVQARLDAQTAEARREREREREGREERMEASG